MEWLGYVRKSRYDEALERCKELDEKVRMLEEKISELQNENSELRKRLEKIVSKPRIDVTEVKGLGTKRAERLKKAGIETVMDLAEASVEVLVKEVGISEEFASKLIKRAKAILKEE